MVTCRQTVAKLLRSKIQDGCRGGHLKNLFFASSPKPKGNMVGKIAVIKNQIKKWLKSFQTEIQDGGHPENLFFASFPEPKDLLT